MATLISNHPILFAIVYWIIGLLYSFHIHKRIGTKLADECNDVNESTAIGCMEYIVIPVFYPLFILYRIIVFRQF